MIAQIRAPLILHEHHCTNFPIMPGDVSVSDSRCTFIKKGYVVVQWQQDKNGKEAREETEEKSSKVHWGR